MSTGTDICIIGGGVIGLAIALELRLRGLSVTLLSREFQQAATHAAAGMLAPAAEAIESSPFLELCLRSRRLYPDWVSKIEDLSGLETEYWACGILAPVYQEPPVALPNAQWFDRAMIHHVQPGLGEEVVGGWWFADDGQVNNRALAIALQAAAQAVGVEIRAGVAVEAIEQQQGHVIGLQTSVGMVYGDRYILATGAWSGDLLPIPVQPTKRTNACPVSANRISQPRPLQRVLYGEEIYIVPRRNGQILLGATVEAVGFTAGNTAGGIQSLLRSALRLYPALESFPIADCWWGFRPATPDELPILGASPCDNLTLAIGHHRNGILLAPITAKLIADVCQQQPDPLLDCFSWQRWGAAPSLGGAIVSSQSAKIEETPRSPITTVQTLDRLPSPTVDTVIPDSPLVIAGRSFQSRLMTGTGKYRTMDDMRQSITDSGSQIVTVAVRRVQTNAPGHEGLAEALDWTTVWMLPNTAGCQTAEDAIRVARLGREMAKLLGQEDNNFVKLEVIPDAKYLLPDPIGTLQAAEQLVKEGFAVLPYINADPLLAKRLEEIGCATVMPLGSPIGSGQGIKNAANIQIIIENANVPVVVDAGIGTPSEAAQAMEMGADALLINTAIAQAKVPAAMGQAMGMATIAGRLAYLAGRIPVKAFASASSPLTGTITS
ncbi:MAG: glycine oxidase ThiO [Leptolyngbyaceae cyanobacterium SL_7_1]|nr:glycine oxidase ThiO [Leptolyngbyaceae cyanobacterium SL_7_1]